MNLLPDKMGGTPKQYAWLGGLLVAAGVVYFVNRTPSVPATPTSPVRTLPSIARPGSIVPESSSGPKLATRSGRRVDDFRPSIKLPEGIDVTKIDPTLKIDLLAKLQKVPLEGGARSVFDYGQAPVPPPPPVAAIKPDDIARKNAEEGLRKMQEAKKTEKPPPAPIPLKFYGYANRLSGPARQAFFLDGEDIQIKAENDVIRNRYKIVRIGINSAVVEDLQDHNQQTLPLVAELNT